MKIEDKAVLVTGASRGLGAALASELARRGARVVLVARGAEGLEETARRIRAVGGEAYALAADVADKRDVYAIAGAAAALAGPISIVIHNASTLGRVPLRPLLDTDCEDLERALAVNLVGPFRITKALAGSMALRGEGLVVQITSDASVSAYPEWGAYSVTKAALDHLGRIWAAELEGTGVRFLTIDPGDMDTQMHRDAVPDADPRTLLDPVVAARRIAGIIERAERLPSGGRFEAADLAKEGDTEAKSRDPDTEPPHAETGPRYAETETRHAETETRHAKTETRHAETETRHAEIETRDPETEDRRLVPVERTEPPRVTRGPDAVEPGVRKESVRGHLDAPSFADSRRLEPCQGSELLRASETAARETDEQRAFSTGARP